MAVAVIDAASATQTRKYRQATLAIRRIFRLIGCILAVD